MTTRVFISQDTTAVAVGADRVATSFIEQAKAVGFACTVIRNGSRGAFGLEPLIEVDTAHGRLAYAQVAEQDVSSLISSIDGADYEHPKCVGLVEDIGWLATQTRVTFARCGEGDPTDLTTYIELGGFVGLSNALALSPQAIVDEIKASGLRGRGGAAFPTGIKWQTVLDTPNEQKYIVCNADEGDSGTFADRLLMEADPFQLIEGMTIAGLAVGAKKGFIYLRSEYPRAQNMLESAIVMARKEGFLGENIRGTGHSFDIDVRMGAGSYICGEETALLNSLEGKRGVVRAKPPLPAIEGLFGKPTVVNNVLTLASVTSILSDGGAEYARHGIERSKGTIPLQLAGNVKNGGLIEVPFGVSLRDVIMVWGEGTRSGRPVRAVQVGGPLGAYLSAAELDVPLTYEALSALGGMLGHGGIVVFDDTVDMAKQAHFAMDFCAKESCGKCTPCRIGAVRGREVLDRVVDNGATENDLILLRDLCDTMEQASLCAMGGLTPLPVKSALDKFPEDFNIEDSHYEVAV
ncbi:MAG TPA: formate dehydrogenase [Halieaceae bacterium]|nr:NADH-quinone oxidoreductase subunit NuoF [Pseudomonadales bacterium]MBL6902401.1 NADH-quinone oxidoreductase subunit NuoF [Luminiphilus sp.]CAI8351035.1 MAG: NADP-reducing hydrogenase subunit HndC [Halieaceae bacterium]HBQ03399.1 formate dehydrogenase [Halieaceae bacterium]